jgi:hypothetical protein
LASDYWRKEMVNMGNEKFNGALLAAALKGWD